MSRKSKNRKREIMQIYNAAKALKRPHIELTSMYTGDKIIIPLTQQQP
jgi:hypothetical protein